jgi:TRAP-type C4-dicarboxylate transport system permease small subunit
VRIPIPDEILFVAAFSLVAAAWLTWAVRSDWLVARRVDLWSLSDAFVSQFLLTLLLATGALQIGARFLLADTVVLPWTEEFARLCMIWLAFWGAAALHRANDHICLTLVYDVLPTRFKSLTLLFVDVLTIALLLPIAWFGFSSAEAVSIIAAASLGLPLSVFAYSVPLLCTLMIVHSAVRVVLWKLDALPDVAARSEEPRT